MDGTPKPFCDWLPAFWRDSVPLVAEARGARYGCETVKRAVANKCFFAGAGLHLNVLERLEQLVELSLTDRAFPWHKAGAFNLLARWKPVPDNQWLPVGRIAPDRVGISYAKTIRNVWPIADMPDFQQGTFVWLAQREPA
jgi:hypothetical protein